MVKRVVVTGLKARGYVDGRYVGEEKREAGSGREDILRGRKRRGKSGGALGPGPGGKRGRKRGAAQGTAGADNIGNTIAGKRGRRGKSGRGAKDPQVLAGDLSGQAASGNTLGQPPRSPRGQPRTQSRKNAAGRKTPFRKSPMMAVPAPSPSQVGDMRRGGEESKSGQFAEALAAQANVKRERLHKVMAQSGLGSRRDMEIMISTGRVMVNGIVATTGTQVSPGDSVLVDQRPVKLKFSEALPRILLYHKPEGEIVTTSDPGNRITVFDNLPPVENGKWVAIGRLDINTSGLLIFTTSGELANRFMHPRYEVEREYAVRILGELTEGQTQALLTGVNIDITKDEEEEDGEPHEPSILARFDSIEKRGGEGVNQWYQVTIKEGRNREVRKMFETQGLTVSRLIRTRFGKIELPPRLSRGKMMELSPEQVRSVLAGAGMKDEAEAAMPAGGRSGRGQRPPRDGQGRPGRQGVPPREGNIADNAVGDAIGNTTGVAGARAPRGNEPGRSRRNRRGGKGARRDASPVSAGPVADGTPFIGDEAFGNRADFLTHGEPGRGEPAHEANGNAIDTAGNPGNQALPASPSAPRGKGGRGRQRRNFRGRGGRNRGGRGGGQGGGEGGGESGGSRGGSEGGGTGGNPGSEGNV